MSRSGFAVGLVLVSVGVVDSEEYEDGMGEERGTIMTASNSEKGQGARRSCVVVVLRVLDFEEELRDVEDSGSEEEAGLDGK